MLHSQPSHRRHHLTALSVAVALLLLPSSACTPPADTQTNLPNATRDFTRPIEVVATVGMVADLVNAVGGPEVRVRQLMGAGVDPHLFKATRDDVLDILRCDLVFTSGLMLEGKMTDTLNKVARRKPLYSVTNVLDHAELIAPEDAEGHPDPHVWMDVSIWARCLNTVTDALVAFDPPHADDYRHRAQAYRETLNALHAYGQQAIATIPENQRVLVTSHDAFHYFGRAYGLEVLAVQGISTESEAGLQQINQLVRFLTQRQIPSVFVESSVPRKSIETLLVGARSNGHAVRIGGELFSDAMGEAGTYEGTYIGMLDHNITLITRALGGQAPAGGFQGKLSLTHNADSN